MCFLRDNKHYVITILFPIRKQYISYCIIPFISNNPSTMVSVLDPIKSSHVIDNWAENLLMRCHVHFVQEQSIV